MCQIHGMLVLEKASVHIRLPPPGISLCDLLMAVAALQEAAFQADTPVLSTFLQHMHSSPFSISWQKSPAFSDACWCTAPAIPWPWDGLCRHSQIRQCHWYMVMRLPWNSYLTQKFCLPWLHLSWSEAKRHFEAAVSLYGCPGLLTSPVCTGV